MSNVNEEKKEEQVSGNMANSMEELKSLGKEMEQMREEHGTNGQGQKSDPIQFDEEAERKWKNVSIIK